MVIIIITLITIIDYTGPGYLAPNENGLKYNLGSILDFQEVMVGVDFFFTLSYFT